MVKIRDDKPLLVHQLSFMESETGFEFS